MKYEHVIYEKKDKIAYITMNRPAVMNAMNRRMLEELSDIWNDFKADDNAWVAIVTGAGDKAFSAGADLRDRFVDGRQQMLDEFWSSPFKRLSDLEIWKPVIAAVNGHCLAGGLELALCCDLRIASENASFGMSEVTRALVPGGGGVQRLPRQIPYVKAMEILLTGDKIDAQEAYRIGLINKVTPLPQLMPAAIEMATKITRNGPVAVRAIKEAIIRGLDLPLNHALRMTVAFRQVNFTTEDSLEGPLAFSEKRPPKYKGK